MIPIKELKTISPVKSVDDIQCVQKVDIYTKMHGLGCKLDTDLRIIQCQDSSIV